MHVPASALALALALASALAPTLAPPCRASTHGTTQHLQSLSPSFHLLDEVLDGNRSQCIHQLLCGCRILWIIKNTITEWNITSSTTIATRLLGQQHTLYSHALHFENVLVPCPSTMYDINVHGPPQNPISGTFPAKRRWYHVDEV